MATHLETERKYRLERGQTLPALSSVAAEGKAREFELLATYYDTPDFALTRSGVSLRRRTGGHDQGWHLKLARDEHDGRLEIHAPLASLRPPMEFRDRVAALIYASPLIPAAVLTTRRREWALTDGDERILALVCVDDVTASVGDSSQSWREAEVELVEGGVSFLDAVETVLAGEGIERAAGGSKVGRALAVAVGAARPPGPDSSAGEVIGSYLALQVGMLQSQEAGVLIDAPDAIHRSRVATRRLRSTLRTYKRVLRGSRVRIGRLRSELRWLAAELGAPRDAEVLRERMLADLVELPDGEGESIRPTIEGHLDRAHEAAHAKLVAAMGTKRYESLQLTLEGLLSGAPRTGCAGTVAIGVLPGLLARAARRAARGAEHAGDRPADLTRWHEVRKAAKAVRYGLEPLVPVLGPPAERLRAAWEDVTERLGEVQDAVVARHLIGELAPTAVANGISRLPFDDLRYLQDRLLVEALENGREALRAALAQSSAIH